MGETVLITVAGKHYMPTTKCVLRYYPSRIIAFVSNDKNGKEDFGEYAKKSINAMKRVAKDVGHEIKKLETKEITGLDFNRLIDLIRITCAENAGTREDPNEIIFNMMNGTALAAAAMAVAHSYCNSKLVYTPDTSAPIVSAFKELDVLDIDGIEEDNPVRRKMLRQLYFYEHYAAENKIDNVCLPTKKMFGKGVPDITKSNFFQHVQVLEDRKLIERKMDSKFRQVSLNLTDKGRMIAKNIDEPAVYNSSSPELNEFAKQYAEYEKKVESEANIDNGDGPVYIVIVGKHIDYASEIYRKDGAEIRPSKIYYLVSADLDNPDDEYTGFYKSISERLGEGTPKTVDYTDIYSVYGAMEEIFKETNAVRRFASGHERHGGEHGAVLNRDVIVNICNGTKAMVVGASTYAFANGCIIAYPSFGETVREIKFYETINNYDIVRMRLKDKYVLKFLEKNSNARNREISKSCRVFKLSEPEVCNILSDLRRGPEFRTGYQPLVETDSNNLTEKGRFMASLIYDFTDDELKIQNSKKS